MVRLTASLTALLLAGHSTQATAAEFFRAQGGHSLDSVFGLPLPLASELDHSQSQLLISATYANQHAGGSHGSEQLLLDGERAELRLSWSQSLRSCLRLGAELPLIAHSEGYFDRAIEDWHQWFGLPNANREETAADQLQIEYQNADGALLTMHSSASSVGDLHLQLIRPAACKDSSGIAARFNTRIGVKLPSGDSALLSGSGAVDWYIDLTSGQLRISERLSARASAGLLLIGDTDLVSNEKPAAVYGSIVVGWQYTSRLQLLTQLDWHTAMFDSQLRELGKFTAQLALGARKRLSGGALLDLALLEDLAPDTAPDVNLHIGYRRLY